MIYFIIGLGAILVSTALLPLVTGYGTVLFQAITLSAYAIVAAVMGPAIAEESRWLVWVVAGMVNMLGYCVLFVLIRLPMKSIARRDLFAALAATALYLTLLFALFPATDGP